MTSRRLLTTTSRILLDAADYMEKHGFCKFMLCDEKGAVCLRGAIYAATEGSVVRGNHWGFNDTAIAADAVVAKHLGHGEAIQNVNWNNAPERTKDEAVSALRSAALSDYALKAV